ncbi:glycosyltransferase [Providencia hangzhouensis]|uniref:glycosyltransferase n=1 Tax=Providencia hangzhouensis TaxID=3031799 RepID=UPI0034DDC31C
MKYYSLVPNIDNRSPNKVARELAKGFESLCDFDVQYIYVKKLLNPWPKEFSNYNKINILELKKMMMSETVVHSHGFFPDFINAILGVIGAKSKRVSTVHSIVSKDLNDKKFGSLISKFWLLILKRLDYIFVLSESAKIEYINLLGSKYENKIHVVANPLIVSKIKYEHDCKSIIKFINTKKKNGNYIIGTCSVLREMKGIQHVINALNRNDNIVMIIVGDGPYADQLKKRVVDLDLAERVFFTGFVADPLPIVNEFDCFLLPSKYEGFPLSLIEAVNLKVPVICNDISIFREFFNESEVSFVDVENSERFNDEIKNLLIEDKNKVELAYKRLNNHYTLEKVVEKYMNIMNI